MSGKAGGLQFDLEWRITLFVVLLVPLMVGLGFWQLQRADEKTALGNAWDQRQVQPPAPLADLWDHPATELAYARVRLRGSFHPEYFLLDNRLHNGRFGYEVLGIVSLADGAGTALVNRGWIEGDSSRRSLPEVPPVSGEIDLSGHVYVAPGAPYLLAEQQLQPGWPKRIQAVEMDKLAPPVQELAQSRFFAYPVRIDADMPGALLVDWKIVNVSPQKHQGYAVQWFTMAAVLSIFYLLRCSNLWQVIRGSARAQD